MNPILPFQIEANESELVGVGEYRQTGRQVKLRADAAAAWQRLTTQARAEGVVIVPISGFRSVEYQKGLYQRAIAKHGSEEIAARWVAYPGTSEHHTGLAIDVGDAAKPETDIETSFEETAAFAWLQKNAAPFGFELSYPRGNTTGIHYEPWHWRFIGTPEARQIIYK